MRTIVVMQENILILGNLLSGIYKLRSIMNGSSHKLFIKNLATKRKKDQTNRAKILKMVDQRKGNIFHCTILATF
jgi:hypothetical protein